MSKEGTRAAWVELVAATKEYLKLPAEPDENGEAVKTKGAKSEKTTKNLKSNTGEINTVTKKQRLDEPVISVNKLLNATKSHVKFASRYMDELAKCEEIPSREPLPGEENLHVIALDCEMIQTVDDDMALARVSAVEISDASWKAKEMVVLDELVMPTTSKDYIVDTRIAITGLTVEDICSRGITKSMARERFLQLLKPYTILIGHALEHDLLALGLKYLRVIDTALLFAVEEDPERFTHSLAHLSRAFLDEDTSRSGRQGSHDSVEDASLALRIVKTIMTTSSLGTRSFPIALPKEATAAKRKLQGALGVQAQVLATRIQVSEGNVKAAVASLKSV